MRKHFMDLRVFDPPHFSHLLTDEALSFPPVLELSQAHGQDGVLPGHGSAVLSSDQRFFPFGTFPLCRDALETRTPVV